MDDVIMVILSVVVPAVILTMALVAFLRSDARAQQQETDGDDRKDPTATGEQGAGGDSRPDKSAEETEEDSESVGAPPETDGETQTTDEEEKPEK